MRTENAAFRQWMEAVRKVDIEAAFQHLEDIGAQAARDGLTAATWGQDREVRIRWLNKKLRAVTYRFLPYELVLKSKGRQKVPREISRPRFQDRLVLRLMARHLVRVQPEARGKLAQDVISGVIGELRSGEYKYYLKLDIRDFYPSLSHDWVRAVLRRTLIKPELVDFYMQAIRTPSVARGASGRAVQKAVAGIPQGLAISNALAELSLGHLDAEIRETPGLAYFRFVDDVLILLCNDDVNQVVPRVSMALNRAGLEIHPLEAGAGKSAVGSLLSSFDFLGYRFEGPRVTVKPAGIKRMEERLSRAFTAYRYAVARETGRSRAEAVAKARLQWHVDLAITGCRFEGHAVGWLAFYSQIRHQQLLEHMDWMVAKKAARFGVSGIDFKSFVRAYRYVSTRRIDDSGYVPNFDTWDVGAKRVALTDVFGVDVRRLVEDAEVERLFRSRIRKEVLELERDAGHGYNR